MGLFLVIGMGKFGSSLATELHRMKHEVLALDEHEDNVADIVNQVTDVVIGDAKDEAVLNSLNVYSYDCVIVAMAGAIEDSILTTMTLKELGAKSIICKAQNERHAKILSLIGVDKVINPEHDMGIRVAHSLVHKHITDFLEISPDYGIMEIITPQQWANKSIGKIDLRKKYGVTVIAIKNAGTDSVSFSPNPGTILGENDVLSVIGSKRELEIIGDLK